MFNNLFESFIIKYILFIKTIDNNFYLLFLILSIFINKYDIFQINLDTKFEAFYIYFKNLKLSKAIPFQ